MNTIGITTAFKKEIRRFMEVWTQTIGAPVVSNVLFLLVFGVALAGRTSGFEGFTYMEVLIPGLVAMGLMTNAFGNPIGSLMISKYTNAIVEILMIPMRGFEINLAYVAAGAMRGLLVGGVTLIVGAFFAPVHAAHPLFIVAFALLMGGAFASFGVMVAIVSKSFDQSSIIQNFILTPLIYLSGVFYSVASLSGPIATASRLNPVFYMVDGLRYGFLGVSDAPAGLSLAVTIVVCAVMFAGASWMFETGYRLKT